ncbi:unnamed protein product, partial [Ixodes persulcatus]
MKPASGGTQPSARLFLAAAIGPWLAPLVLALELSPLLPWKASLPREAPTSDSLSSSLSTTLPRGPPASLAPVRFRNSAFAERFPRGAGPPDHGIAPERPP